MHLLRKHEIKIGINKVKWLTHIINNLCSVFFELKYFRKRNRINQIIINYFNDKIIQVCT